MRTDGKIVGEKDVMFQLPLFETFKHFFDCVMVPLVWWQQTVSPHLHVSLGHWNDAWSKLSLETNAMSGAQLLFLSMNRFSTSVITEEQVQVQVCVFQFPLVTLVRMLFLCFYDYTWCVFWLLVAIVWMVCCKLCVACFRQRIVGAVSVCVVSCVWRVSDNALLVQSRFMLMEGMLIFFSCMAVMSFLKFRNLTHRYMQQ